MPIRILKDEVASQIAAGEVVENPASVVKEVLENSLDAGASQITIRIEGAGRALIEVADNGAGIAAEEMELAVKRHATSKLQTAEDLFRVSTLGFRGEALASMASVSHFTLTSRQKEQDLGAVLRVDGGKTRSFEVTGAPDGTVAKVEDLFYNVPARLKFLKTDSTEKRRINELVTRYALAYPHVRFQLSQDGKTILQTSGNNDRREVLVDLYGLDTGKQMIEVNLEDEPYRVYGFTSPVSLTRSNRREMTFFVNGRWVQDPSLITALLKAYHTLLMVGRYPLAVLFFELPPEEVDVNVHPAKAEVRFRNPGQVFTLVQRAVKRALLAHSPVPQIQRGPMTWPGTHSNASTQIDFSWTVPRERIENTFHDQGLEDSAAPSTREVNLPSGGLPLLRLIGQIGNTYLAAEGPDGLYLVDQHAAHERVLFERYQNKLSEPIPSQTLLEPQTFDLPPDKSQMLADQLDILNHLGFQVELFGTNTFRVRAVPAFLAGSDPVAVVRVVVEEFEEDETPLQNERENRLAARICKRAAVKGGQPLSRDEQTKLLRDLEACQSPRTCPHGRPTMIHLSIDLLERQFGRRGSR